MKAPLAVHWMTKKENIGLLSLTIQHSAVGVSGSKWEHVFPHGGGLGESRYFANYFVKQDEEEP